MGEREREAQRERSTERERQTETERGREREAQRERERERESDRDRELFGSDPQKLPSLRSNFLYFVPFSIFVSRAFV